MDKTFTEVVTRNHPYSPAIKAAYHQLREAHFHYLQMKKSLHVWRKQEAKLKALAPELAKQLQELEPTNDDFASAQLTLEKSLLVHANRFQDQDIRNAVSDSVLSHEEASEFQALKTWLERKTELGNQQQGQLEIDHSR